MWIRSTVHAPLGGAGGRAESALWLLAMAPDGDRCARRATFPAEGLVATAHPFRLCLGGADLSDRGVAGAVDDGAWELSWEPRLAPYKHVHPLARRTGLAQTVVALAHADLAIAGTVRAGERTIELDGACGGQAHLWGSRHAARWAWAHCNDLRALDGEARRDTFVDAVSAYVERARARARAEHAGARTLRWRGLRRHRPARHRAGPQPLRAEHVVVRGAGGHAPDRGRIDAPRATLAGVTYHHPDGRPAYCYNSEVASMGIFVWDRTAPGRFGWTLRDTLVADGRAHFEYGQRATVADIELLLT